MDVTICVFIGVHQRFDKDLVPFPGNASHIYYWPPINTDER
jgi:hypothetical protein